MKRVGLVFALALSVLVPACSSGNEDLDDADYQLAAGPGTVYVSGVAGESISARATTFTLTFSTPARVETRSGGKVVILSGRSSRNIASMFSYVPDDAFGEVVLKSPRTFDVILREGHELNTMLSGMPLRLGIDTATGTPTHFEAALHFGATFGALAGDSHLRVSEVVPVLVGADAETLVYRASITTTITPQSITVAGATTTKRSARKYDADFDYGALFATASASTPVSFVAQYASPATTTAKPILGLRALGLTVKTIDEAWPITCAAAVKSCIARITKASGTDFGECARARDVETCKNEEPPPPANVVAAEKRIEADIKAQTGVVYDTSVGTLTPDGSRSLALAFLPRGGSAVWALTQTTIALDHFESLPSFTDSSLIQRFETQLPNLGWIGAKIVAHGMTTGGQPIWQFVVDKNGTKSTLEVQATSATTSVLVPFAYDAQAFRELAGHLLLGHALAMAKNAGIYATLEVYLRVSELTATDETFILTNDVNEAHLTGSNVWGDNAITVTIDKTTGATTVTDQN
ncbi:hypothetical protein BH09MYX1_BH09MYX1_18350 [soil metagenome]